MIKFDVPMSGRTPEGEPFKINAGDKYSASDLADMGIKADMLVSAKCAKKVKPDRPAAPKRTRAKG